MCGWWIASIKKQDVSKPKCINSVCSPTDLTVFLTSSQLSAGPSPSLQVQGKMMAYDRVVVELNAARLRDASFPVVHAFIQAALSLNPDVRAVHVAQESNLMLAALASSSGRTNIPYSRKNNWGTTWNSATRARWCPYPELAAIRAPPCSRTPRRSNIKGSCRIEKTDCHRSACRSRRAVS